MTAEKTDWRAEKLSYDREKGMTGEDGRNVEINGVAFVCSAGDRQDRSHDRAAEMVRRWNAVPALVEAQAHHLDLLGAMLVMMEDAIDGEIVQDGRRYERGVSDMEISPDGRLTIAGVRAALLSAKGESQ